MGQRNAGSRWQELRQQIDAYERLQKGKYKYREFEAVEDLPERLGDWRWGGMIGDLNDVAVAERTSREFSNFLDLGGRAFGRPAACGDQGFKRR